MSALLRLMNSFLADPHGAKIEHGLDVIALAKLFENLGRWEDAARLFERGLQRELPQADFWQAIRRLSTLQRRRRDLERAVALWQQAAAQGHIYAHVELANYYEHRCKDFPAALRWTENALSHLQAANLPAYIRQHWQEDLEKRKNRLLNKLKRRKRSLPVSR